MYKNFTESYDVRGKHKFAFGARTLITSVIMEERGVDQGVTYALASHTGGTVFSLPSVPGRYIIQSVIMPKGSTLEFTNTGVAFLICEAMAEV